MPLREITPHHLRCGIGQCPAVYEDGVQDLVIIGKNLSKELRDELSPRIGEDEYAIRISRAMFTNLAEYRYGRSNGRKHRQHRCARGSKRRTRPRTRA
jgi:hypothetical protein